MTKTEQKLLDRMNNNKLRGGRGSVQLEGKREHDAGRKLVAKGLATVAHVHKGVYYSRHYVDNSGSKGYSRPHYYTALTIRLAG